MSSRASCGDPVAYGESIGVGLYRASCFFSDTYRDSVSSGAEGECNRMPPSVGFKMETSSNRKLDCES
jgi:hypothetical protein